MSEPALDRAAELAAIHADWLQVTAPTPQDVGAYLLELQRWRQRHDGDGPPEEEPRIETARQLWAWCRHRQQLFERSQSAGPSGMPPAVVGTVQFAWARLRGLAGTSSYPPEPEPPADHAGAVRDLDLVVNWCAGRAGAAAAPGPCASACPVAKVALGGPNDLPVVLGKPKSSLTFAQRNVVKALLDAGPAGLAKDALVGRSGHADAVNILKRLAKDPDWGRVIRLPGTPGRHYRIG